MLGRTVLLQAPAGAVFWRVNCRSIAEYSRQAELHRHGLRYHELDNSALVAEYENECIHYGAL